MKLRFQREESLPRLAWCARMRAGEEVVVVRHGPWVETREDAFVEGAWDGPFSSSHADAAVVLAGSAGRVVEGDIVFATSTHIFDRLHLVRAGGELFVSNSMAFAIEAAGDEPDPAFTFYAEDLALQVTAGIRRRMRELPLRRGGVVLHECANLVIGPDLDVRRVEKSVPPPPADYEDCVASMEAAMQRVFENAADPSRIRTYRPLATLSRGYDAPAVAALARRLGCTEAMTFAGNSEGDLTPDDDGKPIGVQLGLHVTQYMRREFARDTGWPEAEFCLYPPGGDVVLLALEKQIEGSLYLTGRFGDTILDRDALEYLPDAQRRELRVFGGASLTEMRVRVGYIHYPPLTRGWQNAPALQRISSSDAMRPWSVGGSYDRPINRRILEEAGVSRELFGQRKMGGAYYYLRKSERLSPRSRADYEAFCRSLVGYRLRSLRLRLRRLGQHVRARARRGALAQHPGLTSSARSSGSLLRFHRVDRTRAWLFHWGFHRTRARYAPASEG